MMNFIRKYKHGDAVFRVLNVDNINRIIDVLVKIKGDGCLIEKPTNAEGRNWKIIFDGKQSDTPREGANEDPEDPKPLDYLIRFVGGLPRESQYGHFRAQTDFSWTITAPDEWLRDTMLPLGYCYLTFTASGGTANTTRASDSLSTGFSLKAQRKNAGKFYRLAHGNQFAAMMRRGDGNSIQVDVKNYAQAPAYILREWNTDNNYVSIPKSAFTGAGGYDFLTYDTYLPEGSNTVAHPAEIKFASPDGAFFEDLVFYVTNIFKDVLGDNLCAWLWNYVFFGELNFHAACHNYNNDGLAYAAVPGIEGGRHGGWIHLSDLEGLADWDDFNQLKQDVQDLYNKISASPFDVEAQIQACNSLLSDISAASATLTSFASQMTAWGMGLDAEITALRQKAAELSRLESTATSQEARVQALKNRTGGSS